MIIYTGPSSTGTVKLPSWRRGESGKPDLLSSCFRFRQRKCARIPPSRVAGLLRWAPRAERQHHHECRTGTLLTAEERARPRRGSSTQAEQIVADSNCPPTMRAVNSSFLPDIPAPPARRRHHLGFPSFGRQPSRPTAIPARHMACFL